MIGEHFAIRVNVIGQHQLLLILSYVRIVHHLRGIASATEGSRVLLYLKLDLVLRAALVLLVLHIELPNRILIPWMRGLVLRCRHLSWLQIVLAMLRPAVLVRKLDDAVPV